MKKYKVLSGQTIWDVANKTYGSVAYAFKIAKDNSVEINDELTGIELEYDETIKAEVLQPLISQAATENGPQTYYGLANQSIFDVVLQTDGDLGNLLSIVKASSLSAINQDVSGHSFVFEDSGNKVKRYIQLTGRVFGTKPNPVISKYREHDDSFNRMQYT